MPKVLVISKEALSDSTGITILQPSLNALKSLSDSGSTVLMVSGGAKPRVLERPDLNFVQFIQSSRTERLGGKLLEVLRGRAAQAGIPASDIVVLAAKPDDCFQAFNTGTVLLRAGWSTDWTDNRMERYGSVIATPSHLLPILRLLETSHPWYFHSDNGNFSVYCLTNAGTYNVSDPEQLRLIAKLKDCLKEGQVKDREGFKLHLLSSLVATPEFQEVDIWGFYPSSSGTAAKHETILSFTELARTTLTRTSRAKGELFIRHQRTDPRHSGSGSRTDPKLQVSTIHLNPNYDVRDKTVAVLDDFCSYGLSFGVADALLKRAGAKKVLCVAMGKFGNQARRYAIDLRTQDPFQPLDGSLVLSASEKILGQTDHANPYEFLNKFRAIVK